MATLLVSMQPANSNLDDIAAVIGYTPTRVLVAWYAGRRLYVPVEPREDHPLRVILGPAVLRRLMREWAGQHLRIPSMAEDQRLIRDRGIAESLVAGESDQTLAQRHGITSERVGQIRRMLTANGLLEWDGLLVGAEETPAVGEGH